MIGAVMMATWAGLTGFAVMLAAGYSVPVALVVYSVLGTVTLSAALMCRLATHHGQTPLLSPGDDAGSPEPSTTTHHQRP